MNLYYLKHVFRIVLTPLILLLLLIFSGIMGYSLIEDWNILDSLYMTVITITTVGFGEVNALTSAGRIFTIILILGGVILYALSLNVLVQIVAESKFRKFFLEARMIERIQSLKDHFIIAGGGRMGYAIAEELEEKNKEFIILDTNEDSLCSRAVWEGRKKNWIVLKRDAMTEESLREAKIERARGMAAVLPSDADNLFVVLSARSLNQNLRIETRIINDSVRQKMFQAGANKVLSPYSVSGIQMARSLINPEIDSFMELKFGKNHFEFEVKTHEIIPGEEIDGKKIRDTNFTEKGLTILGVGMPGGEFKFNPGPDFVLMASQTILLFGK